MDKKLKILAYNKNLSLFIDKFAGLLEQLTSGCSFAGETASLMPFHWAGS